MVVVPVVVVGVAVVCVVVVVVVVVIATVAIVAVAVTEIKSSNYPFMCFFTPAKECVLRERVTSTETLSESLATGQVGRGH